MGYSVAGTGVSGKDRTQRQVAASIWLPIPAVDPCPPACLCSPSSLQNDESTGEVRTLVVDQGQ